MRQPESRTRRARAMNRTIRTFMLIESAVFFAAGLIHSGLLIDRYEHHHARVAKSVLAGVLALGLASPLLRPAWTRKIGLIVRAFALVGTMVSSINRPFIMRPKMSTGRS